MKQLLQNLKRLNRSWMTNLSADVIKKTSVVTNYGHSITVKKTGGSEMNEELLKIELNDGTILNLEPKLNIKKLLMINRDFNTDEFAKMTVGKDHGFSVIQGAKGGGAVYIAYSQANMTDYISFDEFIDKWDFDMATASYIYQLDDVQTSTRCLSKEFEKANKEKSFKVKMPKLLVETWVDVYSMLTDVFSMPSDLVLSDILFR